MKEKLQELINTAHPRVIGQTLKTNPTLMNWVMNESKVLDEFIVTLKERIYYILLDKPDVICHLQKKKTFNPKNNNYGFCDNISKCECFREHSKLNYTPRDMSIVVEKRKNTWLEKYGVDNVSKSPDVKEKRKHTRASRNYCRLYTELAHLKETVGFEQVINRVGHVVEPLFTRDAYSGSSRTNVYPWKCVSCSNVIHSHIDYGTVPRCVKCYPKTVSKGENEIAIFIESLGLEIEKNTKTIIPPLELDIFIPSKNIAVEFNGTYWHSSEKKQSDYHVNKYLKCKEIGIQLIQIFEDEWVISSDIIKSRLKNLLGQDDKYHARKGVVLEISGSEFKEFTSRYHLRGYANSTHKYGLFINDELKAVMGFSKSRYTKTGYELVRYCSRGTVVGGASKLLSHFKKTVNPELIVTYADRCWSSGDLYQKLGFTNVTNDIKNVGYWYVKNNVRYHRSNFTKNRLVKLGYPVDKTEAEIMKECGYSQIYDCGNYKFIWESKKGEILASPSWNAYKTNY